MSNRVACFRRSEILKSTEKAAQVRVHDFPGGPKDIWIPRSVMMSTFRNDDLKTLDIYTPLWFGRKVGLIND